MCLSLIGPAGVTLRQVQQLGQKAVEQHRDSRATHNAPRTREPMATADPLCVGPQRSKIEAAYSALLSFVSCGRESLDIAARPSSADNLPACRDSAEPRLGIFRGSRCHQKTPAGRITVSGGRRRLEQLFVVDRSGARLDTAIGIFAVRKIARKTEAVAPFAFCLIHRGVSTTKNQFNG